MKKRLRQQNRKREMLRLVPLDDDLKPVETKPERQKRNTKRTVKWIERKRKRDMSKKKIDGLEINAVFNPYDTAKIRLGYLPVYERNLAGYRENLRTFLELGVHEGQSLLAWRDYFVNAQIVGVDNSLTKKAKDLIGTLPKRITIYDCDCTIEGDMASVIEAYGGFDVVLDDASHEGVNMQKSLEILWAHVHRCYMIEDLDTQWGKYGDQFIVHGSFLTYLQSLVVSGQDKKRIGRQTLKTGEEQIFEEFTGVLPGLRRMVIQQNIVVLYK
jgi:hypothetical protein